jgi:ATP-binding cassette subfamily D (ALD) protein 3
LINLAKAIGRIVVSYKDMQNLAGYTTLIHEMDEVLDDLRSGTYVRTQVVEKEINNDSEQIERTEISKVNKLTNQG